MKRLISGLIAGTLIASMAVGLAACGSEGKAFGSPDVTYKIDGTVSQNAEDQISDLLFGVFLEDINYASYALDDNLIANGSFEFTIDSDYAWTGSGVSLTVEDTDSLVSTNPSYAALTVTAAKGTLTNSGYAAVPIAVQKDVKYSFSAFVKAAAYDGDVTVRVTDGSKTYAEATFAVTTSEEWVKYKAELTATESASSGLKFVVEFASTGALLLDAVQLETNDSTVGIKQYMYDAIADLSPKFIRFPGGCVIEGRTMEDAYDWKNSIGVNEEDKVEPFTYTVVENGQSSEITTYGEAATRTPNTDIWQTGSSYYQMDYAIGFYEYFLLCDSIGASAIPIVNVGLSCMIQTSTVGNYNELEGRYGNGIDDYIDEALDLVAFAIGDPDSSDSNEAYWAGIRKAMGHEEPFDMRYLGIGNEQWGTAYYEYYQSFLVAFKEAAAENPIYGEVELIVGNGTVFGNCEKGTSSGLAQKAAQTYKLLGKIDNISDYGVQDHHYYMNYVDFFSNTTLYDGYSRKDSTRYDVFLGEYSANMASNLSGVEYDFTANSWLTALSEAAYMTGLERNGDVVKLAAYAPMFGNYTSNQWAVNMMFFTNTQLVLTPNYYVQQLFAKNQGSTVLATETEYSSKFEATYTLEAKNGSESTKITKLYQIVSSDAETGDIIIKLVNASGEDVKVNFEISSASLAGTADYTVLQSDSSTAVNTKEGEEVSPVTYSGKVSRKFGYTAQKYSVTAIRVHVK